MARTFKAEGRQLAKWVRTAFVVVALLLYGYAFPDMDRTWLAAILMTGWLAGELAAWLWMRRRRAAKSRRTGGDRSRAI